MSKLSDALAACKVWMRFNGADPSTMSDEDTATAMKCKRTIEEAAPDMVAWIEKALPFIIFIESIDLETLQEDLSPEKKAIIKRELAELDALIAEVRGEGR